MSSPSTRQPAEHRSLAAAFAAPTTRAAGLAGILPARPRPSAPTPAPANEELPAGAGKPARSANSPQRVAQPRQRASKEPADEVDDDRVVNLAIYPPPDLIERLKVAAQGRTYADVVLEAFEHIDDERLRTALAPTRVQSRRGIPGRPVPVAGGAGYQRQLRVTRAQRRWIEAKATELGVSRSALCVQVLRLHLVDQDPAD